MTSYRHVGEYFLKLTNTPRSVEQSRDYINVRGTLDFGDKQQYSVTTWCKNLTEELGCSVLQTGTGVGQNYGCAIDGTGEAMYGMTLKSSF